jgi:hypothetical protein
MNSEINLQTSSYQSNPQLPIHNQECSEDHQRIAVESFVFTQPYKKSSETKLVPVTIFMTLIATKDRLDSANLSRCFFSVLSVLNRICEGQTHAEKRVSLKSHRFFLLLNKFHRNGDFLSQHLKQLVLSIKR